RSDASPVAIWYALSWFVTGFGISGEISNALGYSGSVTKVMNSQVAAISAAVLAGIALAAKLQLERTARILAQTSAVNALQRFRENYNAMPVGIFSIRHDGIITEHNPTFAEMFPVNGRRGSKVGMNLIELTNFDVLKAVKELTASDRMMDTEIAI